MDNTSSHAPPQILVCDDSDAERAAVVRWLTAADFGVHEAADGHTALRLLRERRIDLVLLDLNMPEVDGFGVLNYLQEHRKALPVILLSGMSPGRIQVGMSRLKSHELPPLLLKPIDPEQLLAIIALGLAGELEAPCNDV